MLLSYQGIVSFAHRPVVSYRSRGSDQSSTPLVSTALRNRGRARTDTRVLYRTGGTSETVYGDCADAGGWLVAVLAADRVPWLPFSVSRPGTGSGSRARWWTCESCGELFPVSDRCLSCDQPRCTSAGHCACSVAREKQCSSCFMVKHVTLFEVGDTMCRECRG